MLKSQQKVGIKLSKICQSHQKLTEWQKVASRFTEILVKTHENVRVVSSYFSGYLLTSWILLNKGQPATEFLWIFKGRAGRENIWLSVRTYGPRCTRSVCPDLEPNIFPSGPPTQSISILSYDHLLLKIVKFCLNLNRTRLHKIRRLRERNNYMTVSTTKICHLSLRVEQETHNS